MKKLKVLAAALLASALPLSGCSVLGVEIPGSQAIMDLLNKVDIFDIIPDKKDDKEDDDDDHDHDHDGDDPDPTPDPVVKNVTVTGAKDIYAGEKVTLTARVSGEGNFTQTVTWSTSDSAVATVNDGVVTGVAKGTVDIIATSTVDTTKSGKVTINVKEAAWPDAQKEIFNNAFGEAIPFVVLPEKGAWTEEWFEQYECITFEVEGDKTAEIEAAFAKVDDYEQIDSGVYIVEFKNKENTVFYINDYYNEKDDLTSIDVYKAFTTWPGADIAARVAGLGITLGADYALPALPNEEGMLIQVMNSAFVDEEGEKGDDVVVVSVMCAEDSETLTDTYLDLIPNIFDKYVVLGEEGEYQLQAKDKSHTIQIYDSYDEELYEYYMLARMFDFVDELCEELGMTEEELIEYLQTPFPGFTLVIAPYQYDYSIYPTGSNELLAVGDTLQIETQLGSDVPQDAVLTYTSGTPAVATVSETGLITAVGEGIANITVAYEDKVSVTFKINVVETLPTAWTEEQIGEIQKLYPVVEIPFIKYFDDVKFVENGQYVQFSSSLAFGYDQIDNIGDALEAAGWELQSEYEDSCASEEVYYEGAAYFEKVYQIGEVEHYISIALGFQQSQDEDAEALPIVMYVHDPYFYSFNDAAEEIIAGLGYLEAETEAELPTLSATRYSVQIDDYYGSIDVVAYNEGKTLEQVKALLEGCGYTVVQKVDGEIAYLDAIPEDEGIEVIAYVVGADLYFQIYVAEGGGGEEESAGAEFDFAEITETSGEANGFSFTTAKASGQSDPAYNEGKKELRLYANNTITFTSDETMTSIFFDANTCGESKATGTIVSASVGTVSAVEGGFLWEGEANEVTLTASASGQVHINSIVINGGGGEGGGGESAEFEALMTKVETAYGIELEYDDEEEAYFSEEVVASSTSKTMMQVINEAVAKKPAEFSIEYEAPYEDTWSDGEAGVFACYLTADQSAVLQLGTWVENGQIYLQVVIYELYL